MGKIFNYYLSDPELNNSIKKISTIIDTQARDNIAHNIYDLDYDNAKQLAVEYDTDFLILSLLVGKFLIGIII